MQNLETEEPKEDKGHDLVYPAMGKGKVDVLFFFFYFSLLKTKILLLTHSHFSSNKNILKCILYKCIHIFIQAFVVCRI